MKILLSAILLCTSLYSTVILAKNQIQEINLRSLLALEPAKSMSLAGRKIIQMNGILPNNVGNQFTRPIISIGSQYVIFEPGFKPIIKGVSTYIYLQFTSAPSASELAELRELNIELSGYLKGNTWVAKITAKTIDTLQAKTYIYALADIIPQDKMSPKIFNNGFAERSLNSDGTHSVLISLRKNSDEQALADLTAIYQGHYKKIDRNLFLVTIADAKLAQFIQETIVAWVDNAPLEAIFDNSDSGTRNGSAVIHNTLGLRGKNVRLGIWDEGDVGIHNDLNDTLGMDRVNHIYSGSISSHATHVAGTMIGNGSENSMATGMAPEASLWSYRWDSPLEEMDEAVTNFDIHSANHSWGYPVGWTYLGNIRGWVYGDDIEKFGHYDINAQQWDQAVIDTDLVMVVAAGNDRSDEGNATPEQPADQAVIDTDLVMVVAAGNDRSDEGNATPEQPADYAHLNGYDTIPDFKNAKNVITVGSVDKSDMSSPFSNWGPSDDGRVKPDLVAIGSNIFSTSSNSSTSYTTASGTSMASPAVNAIAGVVREHYESTLGLDASAAMVKALLIQTAEDMGRTGPDYQFGWGMVRADNAIDSINVGASRFVDGNATQQGQQFIHTFDVTSTDKDVKVTLVWTDIPATPFSAKTLINDFNLELVDPNGVVHFPWILGGLAAPEESATRGINTVDNVEQVVAAPVVGEWEVRIHANALEPGTSQAYSVVNNAGEGPIATCSDYTDSNQNHETQDRAYSESTIEGQTCFGVFCWGGTTVSTWYANGSNNNLGTNENTQTTLHSFSTAPQVFLVNSCPIIDDSAPTIDSLNIAVNELFVTVSGSASDINGDLTTVELQFDNDGIWVMATGTTSWMYSSEHLVGNHQVQVRATDSNDNQTSEIANFDLIEPEFDTVAPVMTLNGSATIQLTVGDNYIEQGATATDDTDGDITALITQVGSIDTNTEGTYQLTYSVTDAAGNQTSMIRTIEVTPPVIGELACELDSLANHLAANRVKVLYLSLYYSTDAAATYLGSTYIHASNVISMQEVEAGGWAAVSTCP